MTRVCTTATTYRSLLRYECEHRKPTAAEQAGMRAEVERLRQCKGARERLLAERYEAAVKGKARLTQHKDN